MFEFAISQHQRHRPSRRLVASALTSFALHLCLLLILVEYPQLLGTGTGRWFRAQFKTYPLETKEWRPVATVSPGTMEMPPAEVLKRLLYDFERDKERMTQPPIRVRWSAQQLAALEDKKEVGPPRKPVPGTEEPVAQPAGDPSAAGTGASAGTPQGKSGIIYLPPAAPSPPPTQIPDKVAEAPQPTPERQPDKAKAAVETPSPKKSQAQVFSDQKAAIRSEGSGLFDTKGFPMGDYASAVIERVKANWLIPSNLRNSQGRTTVVFFIGRDGRFMDARIVVPSGSSSLDLAALSAVIGSNPFPPLPQGFPGDRVGAKFVFSYNENP